MATRMDLSRMVRGEAIEAALHAIDTDRHLLLCAVTSKGGPGFAATAARSDMPIYADLAATVRRDVADPPHLLSEWLRDGVPDADVQAVIGLMFAVAQPVWEEEHLTPDDLTAVEIRLQPSEMEVLLHPR